MKSTITTIIVLIICQLNFAQLTQEDVGKLEIEDGKYLLDVLKQKKEGDTFITTNHKRYAVTIFQFTIENQKVYDTLYGKTPMNEDIKYEYYRDTSNNLRKMSFFDFKGNLKKEIIFNYDEDNMLSSEIEYDENGEDEGEETVGIYYYYKNCKPEYISDLIDDIDVDNINETFSCYTTVTVKKISNYTTSVVNVSKIGFGKIKKINLEGNKDSPISRFYTYSRDDNGNVISVDMTKGEKVRHYKTNEYNEKGDLIHTKSGFVEFFYTYKYDEQGNWTEKIETSKVKGKRIVYRRTF
jgi:YD repeat-containing protein